MYVIAERIKDKIIIANEIIIKKNYGIIFFQMLITFLLVTFAFIFFRSPDLYTAGIVIKKIAGISYNDFINFAMSYTEVIFSFILILLLMVKEKYFLLIPTKNTKNFYVIFIFLILSCYVFGILNNKQFIYFQF